MQLAHDQSAGDMDRKCGIVRATVASLPGDGAIAFSQFFNLAMDRAYSWPLWGAADVINGFCSDDKFFDFRATLTSRGRRAFEAALADPESLASEDGDPRSWFYEGYQYAVADGVEAAAGSSVSSVTPYPLSPSGTTWSRENLKDLYPRLTKKFS